MISLALVAAAAVGLNAFGPGSGAGVAARTSGADFSLVLRLPRDRYRAGEPIDAIAELTYTGPRASVVPWGSASGIIGFGVAQMGGPSAGPGYRDNCAQHSALQRGVPLQVRFAKSGGYAADDPNVSFYRSYFAEPRLRLPAGTWTILAETNLIPGGCTAPVVALRVSTRVVVSARWSGCCRSTTTGRRS
ncbi:MAG: hypothetical protein DLM71_01130 [Chloroflexi bacterium]|nr:MAG: hypothetical protein DLM71_01130 [Chloroflexota bacterium]